MELVRAAVWAQGRSHDELFEEVVAALLTAPMSRLARDLTSRLAQQVAGVWERGWQPADVHRLVARQLGPAEAALLAGAVVTGSASYRSLGAQVAPRWMGQIDALAGGAVHHLPDGGAPWTDLLVASLRLLHALEHLPVLPILEPPPSAWHAGMQAATDATGTDPGLDGVRTLLARAEASDVDAEAEACTVEAQQLAARRRLDRAAVAGEAASEHEVVVHRIRIDAPYTGAKAALLAGVCLANGARSVWTEPAGFTAVFGFRAEVDVVEELYRSLLVQSSSALKREGSKHDRFGRSRTTRFRRAFLDAFAQRMAIRLRAVADATLDADGRSSLLAVLAARDAVVEAAVAATFPGTAPDPAPGRGESWVAPTLFDDPADLDVGGLLERRSAS